MSFQITIKPSNHVYTCQKDETILDSALREGFTLPYGCRNGACGSCKGKVMEGSINYGEYQASALSEADKADGYALFCCATPLSDLVIECREVGATKDIPVKTLPCRVQSIDKITPDVAILSLKLPANENLKFLAGQYIDILLKGGKRRSFSLANAPHDNECLQLHIRHVPGGEFSDYVFNQMEAKAILRFEGPLGTFFLREDSDKPIILLATGTGFAPIKGIIDHALHAGSHRELVLYWGGRTLKDLYMVEHAAKWQQNHKNITVIPVLSQPTPEDNWQGRIGHVQDAALKDFGNLSGYQVYACGSPKMVEDAHRLFTANGLPDEEFFSDAFTFARDKKPAPAV